MAHRMKSEQQRILPPAYTSLTVGHKSRKMLLRDKMSRLL